MMLPQLFLYTYYYFIILLNFTSQHFTGTGSPNTHDNDGNAKLSRQPQYCGGGGNGGRRRRGLIDVVFRIIIIFLFSIFQLKCDRIDATASEWRCVP